MILRSEPPQAAGSGNVRLARLRGAVRLYRESTNRVRRQEPEHSPITPEGERKGVAFQFLQKASEALAGARAEQIQITAYVLEIVVGTDIESDIKAIIEKISVNPLPWTDHAHELLRALALAVVAANHKSQLTNAAIEMYCRCLVAPQRNELNERVYRYEKEYERMREQLAELRQEWSDWRENQVVSGSESDGTVNGVWSADPGVYSGVR